MEIMIQTLLKSQRDSLNHFFDQIHLKEIEAVFQKILQCKGSIIVSGVGKSGHIGQKVVATLISTGTKAWFLSPTHALHGDIGLISSDDIFLSFSKSGESQELLDLLPHIQKKGIPTIAVVSQVGSTLSKLCSLTVHLPVQKEMCPYNLVPTTSTTVQLIFGDCLAISLMQEKQFTLEHFAANHPAGFLGRKINLKVSDLMLKRDDLPFCHPKDLLVHLLHELSAKKCGCLLIVDPDFQLKGIFTDGDLRRAIHKKGAAVLQEPIENLMTHSPETISPDVLALAAIEKMEAKPDKLMTTLPVIDQGAVVGLIRMHDIIQMKLR
jgi:arabinose-5-phosphate isomerase